MTMPAPVSHAVQTLQVWLKELKDKGELADEAAAYSVLRSVLHQLRDRLTLEEGVDLGAQLPLIVRGLYYDGWRPHRVPQKLTKEKFLDELSKDILPHTYPVEWAVSTVFALMVEPCPGRSVVSNCRDLRSFGPGRPGHQNKSDAQFRLAFINSSFHARILSDGQARIVDLRAGSHRDRHL